MNNKSFWAITIVYAATNIAVATIIAQKTLQAPAMQFSGSVSKTIIVAHPSRELVSQIDKCHADKGGVYVADEGQTRYDPDIYNPENLSHLKCQKATWPGFIRPLMPTK